MKKAKEVVVHCREKADLESVIGGFRDERFPLAGISAYGPDNKSGPRANCHKGNAPGGRNSSRCSNE